MRGALLLLLSLCLPLFGCVSPKVGGDGTAQLTFHSFSGGGPTYTVKIEDERVLSVERTVRYNKKDHMDLDGAGYDVYFTFTGKQPGTTALTVEQRSPIAGNFDRLYEATVDEALRVTLRELSVTDLDQLTEPTATLVLEVNGSLFYAALADTPAAAALRDKLNEGPLAVELHDYGHFEKVGDLPWALETSDEEITAEPGDVLLYQGDKITLYYDANTWSFTRLAKIDGVSRDDLLQVLGEGDVTVLLYLEWGE